MSKQNYLSIYAKSFNWAGFFLPKQTYQKCSGTLYDFCRVIDNIADDKASIELKKINLKTLKIILIIKILMILLLKICGIL